jgi:tetratricopeptide (TPR) repeat protein
MVSIYDKGLVYGKQALNLAQKLDYKKGITTSLNHIGRIYNNQGNLPDALKSFFSSLKIYEEMGFKEGIASCYGNIGSIYGQQGNYAEALKSFFIILKIYKEINNKKGIAYTYINLGTIYYYQNNYPEALKSYLASLAICEEIGDKYGVSDSYNGIGIIYYNQGKYDKALGIYFSSLKIKEEIGDKEGITTSLINLGELYTKLNKIKEAESYLGKALSLSKEIGSKDGIKEAYSGLTVLDSTMGNYKAAFEHDKLYIIYRDSLNNEETKKKSLQASMQYEYDKKEIAAKAEQDKLDAINAEEKQKQQIVIYAVAGLLVLVAVFAVFMYNRFRITNRQKVIIEKQKQKVDEAYTKLEEKNKEVMDSIRYAKHIQTALITSEKYIANSINRLMKNN